jgi:hypothetical protein
MKLRYILIVFCLGLGLFSACSPDDDDEVNRVELRDPEEVKDENAIEIEQFLQTHFYELVDNPQNPNFQRFVFDTIAGENADKTPIADSDLLSSKPVTQNGVTYELYYLKIRGGNPEERHPTFADSTFITYEGITIDNETFDIAPNPTWLDLTQTVRGFYELLPELRGSSGFIQNEDGTFTFNDDFGIGAVFIPSGLAYYAVPPAGSGILRYQPIIFSVQLYRSVESDHDRDGIPTYLEDYNNNGRVTDRAEGDDMGDDLDGDGIPNYLDQNDDGDAVITRDEISDEDGNIIIPYPDSNNDGTPDYLDPDFPGDSA